MIYKFVIKDGKRYLVQKRTDGSFYRIPIDLVPTDKLRVTFQFSDEAPKDIIEYANKNNNEIINYYDKHKIIKRFANELGNLIENSKIDIIDRSSDAFGRIEISYYDSNKNIGKGFYLGNLNFYPIKEEVDSNGNIKK